MKILIRSTDCTWYWYLGLKQILGEDVQTMYRFEDMYNQPHPNKIPKAFVHDTELNEPLNLCPRCFKEVSITGTETIHCEHCGYYEEAD